MLLVTYTGRQDRAMRKPQIEKPWEREHPLTRPPDPTGGVTNLRFIDGRGHETTNNSVDQPTGDQQRQATGQDKIP